jgi:hypothetical protein
MKASKRESLLARLRDDTALWRAEAWASYAQLEGEVKRAECRAGTSKERKCEAEIVRGHLDAALETMAPPESIFAKGEDGFFSKFGSAFESWLRRIPTKVKTYYSGASIERTWAAIYSASAAIYMTYDKNELPAQAARLRGLLAALPGLDWQLALVSEILKELNESKGNLPTIRARLRQVHLDAMDATGSLQADARTLRNTLLVASGALFVVLLVLGGMHMFSDCIIKICTQDASKHAVCPGGGTSRSFDVFTVELAGVLGGILSVVIPLATGERIKTPYRVFNHQMLLKMLAGAATALAGVLLIESHVISQIEFKSTATLLGYAIFFGFSQQVLTGLVDRRASDLGKETPAVKSV